MPQTTFRQLNYFVLKHRLLIFLFALLSLIIVFPFVHQYLYNYVALFDFFLSIILVTGIFIVSSNRQTLTVAIILGILTFTVIWFNIIIRSRELLIFGLLLEISFFALTTTVIISHVLSYKRVTADKIYGAICGYLLLGIIWSMVYTLLEHAFPGSFFFTHGLPAIPSGFTHYPFYFTHFVYYSFVTITTLGYGDITPLSNAARIFSSLEAVVGQLYIAVLIARLVGLHIGHTLFDLKD